MVMPSKSEFVVPLQVGENYYLFSSLIGSLDLIDEDLFKTFCLPNPNLAQLDEGLIEKLQKRGFLSASTDSKYYSNDVPRKERIPRFYLMYSFNCNMRCTYCFEKDDLNDEKPITSQALKDVFNSIEHIIEEKNYKTSELILYGGEPLLRENHDVVCETLEACRKSHLRVSIITNGANLLFYRDLLKSFKDLVNSVIVTIDGCKDVHDGRRRLVSGESSFDLLMDALDFLSNEGIHATIRTNLDQENIRGQMNLIESFFLNPEYSNQRTLIYYRVHSVAKDKQIKLSELFDFFAEIKEFRNKFDIKFGSNELNRIRHLLEEKKSITPRLNYCFLDNTYVFSPSGQIYSCTEAIGDESFLLGESNSEHRLKYERQNHLVSLESGNRSHCPKCNLRPICAGGCRFHGSCNYFEIIDLLKRYIEVNY